VNLAIAPRLPQRGLSLLRAVQPPAGRLPRAAAAGELQLGAGTDIAQAARLLPGAELQPLVDPVLMREGNPDEVTAVTASLLRDSATAPAVTLCAWSFDRDTPMENVTAMYEAVGNLIS